MGLAGCVERDDGCVLLLWYGLAGWTETVWDLEEDKRSVQVTVNGFWPRKWKWCGWRSGGMDMVNFCPEPWDGALSRFGRRQRWGDEVEGVETEL